MYHSISILVKDGELRDYFDSLTKNYNNMINTTHFHIRQCMTGLSKEESKRFPNENEVINSVKDNLTKMNTPRTTKNGDIKKCKNNLKAKKKKHTSKHKSCFEMPTGNAWFQGYVFWNRYFQVSENKDYYELPGQVNQQAIKDAIESWTGYFNALKSFKSDAGNFTGKPKAPHYRKSGSNATVTLSNQICKFKSNTLMFPKTKLTLNLGNADFLNHKLKETKIKPVGNNFEVILMLDDGVVLPETKEDSKRIIGIDIGIDNIAAISNNIGLNPIVIKGNVFKSYNQWFNKKNADLQSRIDTSKKDDEKSDLLKQRNNLFDYRRRFFKDSFSKIGKYIIEYCKDNNIDTIVIGKNDNWKQEINIGKKNNQTFCFMPHQTLIFNIQYRAMRNGIKVILNEESYTSKASFLDNDNIPNYKEVKNTPIFSGKRVKRGLYKSRKGIFINADINGASNIIRKAIPTAFNEVEDFSYLYIFTESKKFHDFNRLPEYKRTQSYI